MNKEEKGQKTGVARLVEIAGEYWGLLALSGFLSIISTVLQFLPFLSVYFIAAELIKNAATPELIDAGLIRQWGLLALIFLVAALIFLYASTMSSHIAAFHILYNLRMRLSRHLSSLPLGYHNRQSTGAIKKILELNVEKIENFVAHQIPDLIGAVFLPVVTLAALFILDWRLALASTIPIIIAYFIQMRVFSGKGAMSMREEYQNAMEKMNTAGVEYVRGMPAVKVFGLTVENFKRFNAAILGYRDAALFITTWCKRPYMMYTVILTSLLAFILPVVILLLSGQPGNQALALTIIIFLVMVPGLSIPIIKLMYLGGSLSEITLGVKRIDQIFAQKPIPEPAHPQRPKGHAVSFENVFFSYDDQDAATRTEALSGVSFTAREGEITALVGPSGSGKSTIANLIPRFWDISSGAIKIGGVDVREIGTEKLMDTVSFVFQDVYLFYDSIEENIRMGHPGAGPEDVIRAAKAACSHEFIERLPEGYRTKIGEGGTYLSGGEAQRVAIARAILKNAPILVLDEATAFADPENEVNIQQGLISLIRNKTVIVIAHRLRTIREADQIVVVENGQIAGRGTHEELLSTSGLYRRMWEAHIDAGAWELSSEESNKEYRGNEEVFL